MSSLSSADDTHRPSSFVTTEHFCVTTRHADVTGSDENVSASSRQTAGNGSQTDSCPPESDGLDTGELLTDVQSTSDEKSQSANSLVVDGVQCADIDSEVTIANTSDEQCTDTQQLCMSLSDGYEAVSTVADRCDKVKADTPSLLLNGDTIQTSSSSGVSRVDDLVNASSCVTEVSEAGTLSASASSCYKQHVALSQVSVSTADNVADDDRECNGRDDCTDSPTDRDAAVSNQQDTTCKLRDPLGVSTESPVDKAALVNCPVDKAAVVQATVNHIQLFPADTDACEDDELVERQNQETSVKRCADAVVLLPVDLTDSSVECVSIDLFSADEEERFQSAVDCSSAAASISQTSTGNENKDEEHMLCESKQQSVTELHSGTVGQVTEVVEAECSSTQASCSSGECNSVSSSLAVCSSVSAANTLTADAYSDCEDLSLRKRSEGKASSVSDGVISNDELVSLSAAAVAGTCVSTVALAQNVTSDSKCLSINSSLAQTNRQVTTAASDIDSRLRNAAGDAQSVTASDTVSDIVTATDTDSRSALCSSQRYVSNVDISMSSFCTQPLKSLADLVQKVSIVSSSGGTELLEHLSKKSSLAPFDAESVSQSVAAVRNSPLYSGRVSYMTTCPTGRSRRAGASAGSGNTALQQSMEQNGLGHVTEFKKPSPCTSQLISNVLCRPSNDMPQAGHKGDVAAAAGICYQPGTSSSGDVDGIKTSNASELSAAMKNVLDESGSFKLVDDSNLLTNELASKRGRKDKKSSAGRCKNRARKCNVDVVDVKLLKDLIVACSSDRVASSCRLMPDGEAVKTSTAEMAENVERNDSIATHGDEAQSLCETESKLSVKEQKRRPRKGGALERKTTKLMNDITLVDVAAVKSCVEKDYTEFIKSIQQNTDNKTAGSDSKIILHPQQKTKKKKKTESSKNLAAVSEEMQIKGGSSKSKQSRKKTSDSISDRYADPNVKSTRSRSKKRLPQNDVDTLRVDKCHELPVTDSAHSVCDDAAAGPPTDEEPRDFAVPNSVLPTCKKNAARKKKKSSVQKMETKVIGAETRSHRKTSASKTQPTSQETVDQDRHTEDELTENNVTALNSTVDGSSSLVQTNRTKKSRQPKKKSALLDSGGGMDACQGAAAIDCSTSGNSVRGKSRKRKSQVQSSVVASDTLFEPAVKTSKNTDNSSLEAVESAAEPCATEISDAGVVAAVLSQIDYSELSPRNTDVKREQRKEQRQQKMKKRKKQTRCSETGTGTNMATQDEQILEKDSETKTGASQTVIDSDIESGQGLTKTSSPLNDQTVTSVGRGEDEIGTVASVHAEGKQDDIEQTRLSESATLEHNTALNTGSCFAAEAAGKDDDADEQKLFACQHCSYKARKKGQLRKHLSVHKLFNCAHCEFSADTQASLDEHMSVRHPSRCGRRLCKRCHMLFRAGKAFTEHVEQCTGVKLSWRCPMCGKNFKFISAMRTHVHRWHGGDSSANDDAAATCREMTVSSSDSTEGKLQLNMSNTVDTGIQLSPTAVSVQSAMTLPAAVPLSAAGPLPAAGSEPVPTAIPVPAVGPVHTTIPVPAAVPVPTAIPVPGVGLILAAGPAPGAAVVPDVVVTAGNADSCASAVELSPALTATVCSSSTLPSDYVSLSHSALPDVTSELINASGTGNAVNCLSNTEPGSITGQHLEPSSDIQSTAVNMQADRHEATKPTSSSSSVSAVTIDGELRFLCDHCPKSFKAKRSMVHHRRMIHEGGRLRKKEAAAAAAAAAVAGDDDDGVKTEVDDGTVTPAGRTERAASDVVDDVVETLSSSAAAVQPTEQDALVEMSESLSSAAAADAHPHPAAAAAGGGGGGAVRPVYSCSFAGCCQRFRCPGQLLRHEEKHAGPGMSLTRYIVGRVRCRLGVLYVYV